MQKRILPLALLGICVALVLFVKEKKPAKQQPLGGHSSIAPSYRFLKPKPHDAEPPAWFGQRGAPPRRIAGRVTLEGRPFPNAKVDLLNVLTSAGAFAPQSAITDADGAFDFGNHRPASFVVTAAAPGYVSAIITVDLRDPIASPPPDRLDVRLTACEATLFGRINDSSHGAIPAARVCIDSSDIAAGCKIADTEGRYEICLPKTGGEVLVRVDANGYGGILVPIAMHRSREKRDFSLTPEAVIVGRTIRADNGAAVPGALVVMDAGEPGFALRVAATVSTLSDENGDFTLVGLAAGRHLLRASADGLASSDAYDVVADAGQTSPRITMRLATTSRVSGIVVMGSEPVSGATVKASSLAARRREYETAITQSDGTFVLDRVFRGPTVFAAEPYEVISPKEVAVTRLEHVGLRINVAAMGSISGRVTRSGLPVYGARVSVSERIQPVVTNIDGTYIVRGLRPDTYHMSADDDRSGSSATGPVVAVARGEAKSNIDIDLKFSGSISGIVQEENGSAIGGVVVVWQLVNGEDASTSLTSPDGSFSVTKMHGAGEYHAEVRTSQRSPSALTPASGGFPTVALKDNATHVEGVKLIVHRDHLNISGRVVGNGDEPLADVSVSATRGDASGMASWRDDVPTTISQSDGTFRISDLDSGTYDLQARAGDGGETLLPRIMAGSSDVIIRMKPTGAITGTLVGFRQTPEVSATRQVSGKFVSPRYATITGDSFAVGGLAAGLYELRATSAGEGDVRLVQVDSGSTVSATLQSQGTASINGHIVEFRSGSAIPGFKCVRALRSGYQRPSGFLGLLPDEAYSDEQGMFQMTGVPSGELLVVCFGAGDLYSDGKALLTLSAGEAGNAEVTVVRRTQTGPLGSIGAEFDSTWLLPRFASIAPNGPSDRAGLAVGDAVTAVDGKGIDRLSNYGVSVLIRDRPYGSTAKLTVQRGSGALTVPVVVSPPDR